jgi:predicted S18 family serine protease
MSAARSMVSQAQSLAGRYAPAELHGAEAKLARAEAAYRDNDWTTARRLAEDAEADASYALSVAENERTRRASAELAQSIDQLKRELEGRP